MARASGPPPADRFWARVDRFECACPSCGKLILPEHQRPYLPARLHGMTAQRNIARDEPANRSVRKMIYNPYTQLLRCPWCEERFVAGLLLFPLKKGSRRPLEAPLDAEPTRSERLEMTRLGGGWAADEAYQEGETSVNYTTDPCCCPVRGWASDCPVHGHSQLPPVVPPAA